MPASTLLEFIDPANAPPSPNLLHLYSAVEQLTPQERKSLAGFMRSIDAPKPVDTRGRVRNCPGLTITDRKSILYLSEYAYPRAGRDELSAMFGVSRQRVSQITGANGHSRTDAALLEQFVRASPSELRDQWRVEAHVDKLTAFRAGRIAAVPVVPRQMTPPAVGHWNAYGRSFEVYGRDGLFYFLIDPPDELESEPRASAQKALDDCFKACREDAWAYSSGDRDEWFALYKEDPFGPAAPANLIRTR